MNKEMKKAARIKSINEKAKARRLENRRAHPLHPLYKLLLTKEEIAILLKEDREPIDACIMDGIEGYVHWEVMSGAIGHKKGEGRTVFLRFMVRALINADKFRYSFFSKRCKALLKELYESGDKEAQNWVKCGYNITGDPMYELLALPKDKREEELLKSLRVASMLFNTLVHYPVTNVDSLTEFAEAHRCIVKATKFAKKLIEKNGETK